MAGMKNGMTRVRLSRMRVTARRAGSRLCAADPGCKGFGTISASVLAALFVCLCFSGGISPARAESFNGSNPYIVDADTLRMNKQDFTLVYMDALELKQKCFDDEGKRYNCGEEARAFLQEKTKDKAVSCQILARDRFLGLFGTCQVNGEDLGELMVSEGWAVAKGKRYIEQQEEARAKEVNMWQGEFVIPAAWRRGYTLQTNPRAGAGPCMVKGNIQADGSRRYYTTNDPDYHRTSVTPRTGEKFFCSVEEAHAAGFTRPGPKCRIKGIVQPDGRKVYFLPEDEPYAMAKVNFQKGDRWFCSPGHAYFREFRRCLIKGKIVPDGINAYYTPQAADYKKVQVIRENGDKWLCDTQMAVRAGFIRRMP